MSQAAGGGSRTTMAACEGKRMTRMPFALICLFALAPSWAADKSESPSGSRASQLQDLAVLRRYVALDAAYSEAQRALASQAISESEVGAGKWSAAQFELQVARVAALADNGHSAVWGGPRSRRMNRLPVRLVLFVDGVFVVRAKGAGVPGLGLRVDAVDGVPTAEVLHRLRAYRGGPESLRDYSNVDLLESPQLLNAAGICQSGQEVTLTLGNQARATDMVLAALPPNPSEPLVQRLRYLAAPTLRNEGAEWQSAFHAQQAPLWLQEPDEAFRIVPLPELATVYLQLKTNTDAEHGERISTFLARAKRVIAESRPQNVILDMRFNGGGDYTKTAAFMSKLPSMIPDRGRVFVITHTTTFSAGISSVGFVKQASPKRVTIVGEPSGDRLVFYGEPRDLVLPNSGIGMSYATGLHDYLHGCHWFGPCYWVNWFYPIAVSTLDPELMAPISFESVARGRDPAMEAITRRLQHTRQALLGAPQFSRSDAGDGTKPPIATGSGRPPRQR